MGLMTMKIKKRSVLCWMVVINLITVTISGMMQFVGYHFSTLTSRSSTCPNPFICMFTSFKPEQRKFFVSQTHTYTCTSSSIAKCHSGNVSSSSVNGDIAFLWEWSNFDSYIVTSEKISRRWEISQFSGRTVR